MTYFVLVGIDGAEMIFSPGLGFIPKSLENIDYQVFLDWVAAGNEPQPWNPEGSI